jgi:hypothetical protein
MAMKLEYVKIKGYTKDTTCPHNDACRCTKRECFKCGWNPTVAKMRLDKFRGKKTED